MSVLERCKIENRLKDVAVANEDYDEAKRLKQQLDGFRLVGDQLSRLEAEKRAAVEEEDYDRAKELKIEIQKIRDSILLCSKLFQNSSLSATLRKPARTKFKRVPSLFTDRQTRKD